MGQKIETVTVEIGDRSYTLKAGDDPEYVSKVAQFVDRKLKELAKMAPSLQPTHLAVLTAINIADELFQSRSVSPDVVSEAQSRIEALIEKIPS